MTVRVHLPFVESDPLGPVFAATPWPSRCCIVCHSVCAPSGLDTLLKSVLYFNHRCASGKQAPAFGGLSGQAQGRRTLFILSPIIKSVSMRRTFKYHRKGLFHLINSPCPAVCEDFAPCSELHTPLRDWRKLILFTSSLIKNPARHGD